MCHRVFTLAVCATINSTATAVCFIIMYPRGGRVCYHQTCTCSILYLFLIAGAVCVPRRHVLDIVFTFGGESVFRRGLQHNIYSIGDFDYFLRREIVQLTHPRGRFPSIYFILYPIYSHGGKSLKGCCVCVSKPSYDHCAINRPRSR